MGEAWPNPGSGVFQATLLVLLQWMGTSVSKLVPSSREPRQVGQFSAWAPGARARKTTRAQPGNERRAAMRFTMRTMVPARWNADKDSYGRVGAPASCRRVREPAGKMPAL